MNSQDHRDMSDDHPKDRRRFLVQAFAGWWIVLACFLVTAYSSIGYGPCVVIEDPDCFSGVPSIADARITATIALTLIVVLIIALPGLFLIARYPKWLFVTNLARLGSAASGILWFLILSVAGAALAILSKCFKKSPLPFNPAQAGLEGLRRARPTHRLARGLMRYGYGGGRALWIGGSIALFIAWFGGGTLILIGAFPASLPVADIKPGNMEVGLSEAWYWLAESLGGSETFFRFRFATDPSAPPELPARLQVVRWLGVVLPYWIALPPLFAWLFRSSERRAAHTMLSRHHVVIGYSQEGRALVHNLHKEKAADAIVVIDRDVPSGAADAERRRGVLVLTTPADETAFMDAAIQRASTIFVATESASGNIEITREMVPFVTEYRQREQLKKTGSRPNIAAHIPDIDLMRWATSKTGYERLKDPGPNTGKEDGPKYAPDVRPFNVEQVAVRQLLSNHPLADYASLRDVSRAHIVIMGFDSVAAWLIPQLLQATLTQNLKGPRITLILDSNGSQDIATVKRRYPFLTSVSESAELRRYLEIEFEVTQYDLNNLQSDLFNCADTPGPNIPRLERWLSGQERAPWDPATALNSDVLGLTPESDPVTSIVVCAGTDEENLDIALRLDRLIRKHRRWQAPTLVRLREGNSLQDFLDRSEGSQTLASIIEDFGQDHAVCSYDEIFDPPRDAAARTAHDVYRLGNHIETLAKEGAKAVPGTDQGQEAADSRSRDGMTRSDSSGKQRGNTPPSPETFEDWLWDLRGKKVSNRLEAVANWVGAHDAGGEPLQNWAELPINYVASNRDQVDHWPVKLRAYGYRPCRDHEGESTLAGPWPYQNAIQGDLDHFRAIAGQHAPGTRAASSLSSRSTHFQDSLDRLAALEHRRFIIERAMSGWRYGPIRDNDSLRHPSLRPYEDLKSDTDAEQYKDRRNILNLWDILHYLWPPSIWRPEAWIGILGQTGIEPHQAQIKPVIQNLVAILLCLEGRALRHEHQSLTDAQDDAEGTGNCRRVSDPFAVSAVGPLRTYGSVTAAAGLRDWTVRKSESQGRYRDRFRLIRPRGLSITGDEAQPAGLADSVEAQRNKLINESRSEQNKTCGKNAAGDPCDWWEVDLLPEGLTKKPLEPNAELQWSPGQDPIGGDKGPSLADQEHRKALANYMRDELLPLRESAYLAERCHWLITIEHENQRDESIDKAKEWRPDEMRSEAETAAPPSFITSLPEGRRRPRFLSLANASLTESDLSELSLEPDHEQLSSKLDPERTQNQEHLYSLRDGGEGHPRVRIELDLARRLAEVVIVSDDGG